MRVIVCLKPVPDPARFDKLRLDPETMLLRRDEVPPVINPLDRNALETAAALKVRHKARVTALTMAAHSAVEQLQEALAEVKTLKGLIPICAWCKNIRDDEGYWERLEAYISKHTDAIFTHGICPGCYEKHKEEIERIKVEQQEEASSGFVI